MQGVSGLVPRRKLGECPRFGGVVGVVAGVVLVASFFIIRHIDSRGALIGWNVARVVSLVVLFVWVVLWLAPRY